MALVLKRRVGERVVVTTAAGETLILWVESLSNNRSKVRICFDDPNHVFNFRREELSDARHQKPEDAEDDSCERVADERHEETRVSER